MVVRLQAIRPRRAPMAEDVADIIAEELGRRGFAGDVIRAGADYPAALPWRSRPPKTGPRRGGRRTGTLGRGWRITRLERSTARQLVEVANRTPYAVHVQGPLRGSRGQRQTAEMRRRNWASITTIAREAWARRQPIITRILTQQDPRVARRRPRL